MSAHLGFSPEILRRLGEELVPHPDQGLIELVRNAYDADAKHCTIEIASSEAGGRIVVTDDGIGLDGAAISDGWLILGRSQKRRDKLTGANRVPAGDKGLGRLAGLRLGHTARLTTRPESEPGLEHTVELNWSLFDKARVVEDVPIEVRTRRSTKPPGTTIELCDLREGFSRQHVTRLARSLLLLSDPFEHGHGFRAELLAPEFTDLEKKVAKSYFDEVDYRIVAELDSAGLAAAEVLDWKGKVRFKADHETIARRRDEGAPYASPPVRFELWVFNLSPQGFVTRNSSRAEVADWIKVVGGVHVYQHNLRVPPYGDPGEDWLDMNLRRARSPEFRPSTNTSVGRVVIETDDERLVQKTDRTGFLENGAFAELGALLRDVLDWSAAQHLRVAEKQRREGRKRAEDAVRSTVNDAVTVKAALEQSADPKASDAFARYEKALERQMVALREDVLLYRTLGTVGTTSSAFAHESVKPAARIEQGVRLVRSSGKKKFGAAFAETVGKPLEAIERAAFALARWSRLPLELLRRDKRRARRIDLRDAAREVSALLEPFIAEAQTTLELDLPDHDLSIYATPASVESIVANLLINSITAVVNGSRRPRVIRLSLAAGPSGYATISVCDSGAGLQGIDVEDIWLPGRTTREQGTGLGLTIVRDSTFDLGGTVNVVNQSELGGAEFLITLPMVEEDVA